MNATSNYIYTDKNKVIGKCSAHKQTCSQTLNLPLKQFSKVSSGHKPSFVWSKSSKKSRPSIWKHNDDEWPPPILSVLGIVSIVCTINNHKYQVNYGPRHRQDGGISKCRIRLICITLRTVLHIFHFTFKTC